MHLVRASSGSTLVVLVAALVVAASAGCGSGGVEATDLPSESASITSAAPTTAPSEACVALAPAEVAQRLGWTDPRPAAEQTGRCLLTAGTDQVTIGRRADLGADDYDAACSALAREDAEAPDLATDWLPDGVTACFRGFPRSSETGFAELLLLTDGGALVEVQVSATSPTSREQLRSAMRLLTQRGEAAF